MTSQGLRGAPGDGADDASPGPLPGQVRPRA